MIGGFHRSLARISQTPVFLMTIVRIPGIAEWTFSRCSSFLSLFLEIIPIVSVFPGDSISISVFISPLPIGTLLPLTSIFTNSNPARSISFCLKKGIQTIASKRGTGSKYSDLVITVFPIHSSNGTVLCVSRK
jgi:hypothetical protein